MNRTSTRLAALLVFVGLTVLMTWPQARHMGNRVPDSDDPLLSIWRIAWIAHILPVDPLQLMNGNIFYPEPRTLAFTDAALLQGVVAAPMIWAGVSPVIAYNLLVLGSIALSGWTMSLYAYHLTNSAAAALLSGIVFAFVPYRFDHLHHLELQATLFLPLALLWVDRALESGTRRDVFLAAAAVVAQVYCGIYYAVFLVTALAIAVPLRWGGLSPDKRRGIATSGLAAALILLLLVSPYLTTYLLNRNSLGDRDSSDVQAYSATLGNYLATPSENLVHGGWSGPLGQNERRLFPGAVAMALAGIGLFGFERRRGTLVVTGLVGFVISLGVNTPLYSGLQSLLFIYHGLRSPARASILTFLSVAGLVALGWSRVEPALKRRATMAAGAVALALLTEYATPQARWFAAGSPVPEVYRWLAVQPPSVVLELPLTTSDRLDVVPDSVYMFRSIEHWQPLLNGYSGFFPQSYLELTDRIRTFPDEGSIAYLKERQVDLVIIHGDRLNPDAFGTMTAALMTRPDFKVESQFGLRRPDVVFRLRR